MGERPDQEYELSAGGSDRSGDFQNDSPSNPSFDSRNDSANDSPVSSPVAPPDYDRDLGVIEAITYVTRSCPNGRVIAAARGALEAIKVGGADTMKQQAYFVLAAIQGWRGDRARQVHRSLSRYLEPNDS